MFNSPPEIRIVAAPLEPVAQVFSAAAGAVVDFYGVVRGREEAGPISGIGYEAHEEMARHQLELLAGEAINRFPIFELIIHHRIGLVPVAEPSLFLRVSSGHRGTAFEAAQWLIEELKARVPIWKHPVFQTTAQHGVPQPAPGTSLPPA
jgi:molybdopterin synthase catalytic subunit